MLPIGTPWKCWSHGLFLFHPDSVRLKPEKCQFSAHQFDLMHKLPEELHDWCRWKRGSTRRTSSGLGGPGRREPVPEEKGCRLSSSYSTASSSSSWGRRRGRRVSWAIGKRVAPLVPVSAACPREGATFPQLECSIPRVPRLSSSTDSNRIFTTSN